MARHDDDTGYEMSMRNQETRHDKACSKQCLFNV